MDHHAGNASSGGGRHPFQRVVAQPGILQVIMGIKPTHGDLLWDQNAAECSSGKSLGVGVV
jgi:hypothetical protein